MIFICHILLFLVDKWPRKWAIFLFFIIWKSLNMLSKYLCDDISKIKNMRCKFSSFFHADCQGIIFFCHILLFLVENRPRKWSIFLIFIISKFLIIYQLVLQIFLWWIFKNQTSEVYIFFVFPCLSPWDDFDVQYLTVSGGKMA